MRTDTRVKKIALIIVPFIIGAVIGFGLYHFYVKVKLRSALEKQGATEEQFVEAMNEVPKMILDSMEMEDRMATVVAVRALQLMEDNRIDEAKQVLVDRVVYYIYVHGSDPHKENSEEKLLILKRIEELRNRNPGVDALIRESLADTP
jgi:hypothetical protein